MFDILREILPVWQLTELYFLVYIFLVTYKTPMFLLLELLVLMLSVRLIALKILIPMHYWPVAMNDTQSSSIWQMEDQGNKCLKVVYIIYLKCTSFLKVIMEKDRRGYR